VKFAVKTVRPWSHLKGVLVSFIIIAWLCSCPKRFSHQKLLVLLNSNTKVVTSGTETAYPFDHFSSSRLLVQIQRKLYLNSVHDKHIQHKLYWAFKTDNDKNKTYIIQYTVHANIHSHKHYNVK